MYFYIKHPQNARFAKIDMMQFCFNIVWAIVLTNIIQRKKELKEYNPET